MNKKVKKEYKTNSGAAMMIVVFFFVFISLTILIGIVTPVVREFRIVSDNLHSKQSYFLAESGVEDLLYRMKNNLQFNTNENLILGDSFATTTITDISNGEKEITSLGDTDFNQRKVSINVSTGTGASFSYGVQSGKGGFLMDNNSKVIGSVYSNGTITGSGIITGSAISANGSSLSSDQSNGVGIPTYDITFAKFNATQDFAQSFQISTTDIINKASLYLKKVGSPSNLTIRVVADSSGSPGTTTLASGVISSSLISTNYGWVEAIFSTKLELTAGTTYWIVIDGSYSSSKYYEIGANNNGYVNGSSKIGKYGSSWSNNNPSSADSFFNIYIGGINGLISGITVGENSVGIAHANTVTNSNIAGDLYCQTGTGNNKPCDTGRTDPVQVSLPISEQNIIDWKSEAEVGGIHDGNYIIDGVSLFLGPKKINGNLTIQNGARVTIMGTIWVTGDIIINNNAEIKLHSSFGSSDVAIISDGIVDVGNGATFSDSGTEGSYIMILSTSSSSSAITLGNNAGAIVLYASNGTVNVSNNAGARAINGNYIHLSNNAIIEYESGLVNSNFVGGPSGSWDVSGWKEIE